jgi:hypothetical protein
MQRLKLRTITSLLLFFAISLLLNSCEREVPNDSTGDGIPPAVPTNVKVYSAYDGEIEIDWNANSEIDLSGYNVYRSTDSTNFTLIGFTDQNYYLDDSLNYTTKYFYRVTAIDNENLESEPSFVVSAVPVNIYNPYAPRFPEINARNWLGNISVHLTWDPGYETDIAGFFIYRSTNSGFTPDSSSLSGFSTSSSYSDTSNLFLLTTYYYKIVAVDKGGLRSNPSSEVNDEILPMAEAVYPIGTVKTNVLTFKFIAISVPATYEVSLQTSPIFGEMWSKVLSTSIVNDTISVDFDGNYINYNEDYYWRVVTYTVSPIPNSISPVSNFMLQAE